MDNSIVHLWHQVVGTVYYCCCMHITTPLEPCLKFDYCCTTCMIRCIKHQRAKTIFFPKALDETVNGPNAILFPVFPYSITFWQRYFSLPPVGMSQTFEKKSSVLGVWYTSSYVCTAWRGRPLGLGSQLPTLMYNAYLVQHNTVSVHVYNPVVPVPMVGCVARCIQIKQHRAQQNKHGVATSPARAEEQQHQL